MKYFKTIAFLANLFVLSTSCHQSADFEYYLDDEVTENFLSSEIELEHKKEIKKLVNQEEIVKIGSKKRNRSVNLLQTVGQNHLKNQEETNSVTMTSKSLFMKEEFIKEFVTDSFIQTLFESKNWNEEELFFEEIEDYFDFHTIGRNLLGKGYENFNPKEFNDFVEVFSLWEVSRLLPHIEDLSKEETEFKFLKQNKIEKKKGTLFKVHYSYQKKSNFHGSSKALIFTVVKMKNQEDYKIIDLNLDGVNWLAYRKNYYESLIERGKRASEIISIVNAKLEKQNLQSL